MKSHGTQSTKEEPIVRLKRKAIRWPREDNSERHPARMCVLSQRREKANAVRNICWLGIVLFVAKGCIFANKSPVSLYFCQYTDPGSLQLKYQQCITHSLRGTYPTVIRVTHMNQNDSGMLAKSFLSSAFSR